MTVLSAEALNQLIQTAHELQGCCSDIETVGAVSYAGQSISVPAGDVTQAKTDTNAMLATFKADVAALTDIV